MRPRRWSAIATILCELVTGCATVPAARPAETLCPSSPVVLVFFVDGLSATVLTRMVGQGGLPNIRSEFIDGGVTVQYAVSSLPPVTYPNAVSLITGLYPGHHGVLGNRWFDRPARLVRDYGQVATYQMVNGDFTCPTVFELLADRWTVNVQGHTRRGVSLTLDNKIASGVSWVLGDYSDVDARVGACVDRVIGAADGRRPAVYMSYFPGVDEVGHRDGCDSDAYADALRVADGAIGRILRTARRVWSAPVYSVLVSDHGQVASPPVHRIDLAGALSQIGLSVYQGPLQSHLRTLRAWALRGADAVVVIGADRRAAIHLRGPDGWDQPADAELVHRVIRAINDRWHSPDAGVWNSVDLMCMRSPDGSIKIWGPHGTARIERRGCGRGAAYRLTVGIDSTVHRTVRADGGADDPTVMRDISTIATPVTVSPATDSSASADPLGYTRDAKRARFVARGWHDSRDWLAATCASSYPDFVPQVVAMFDSPRAGDIVLFAADDYALTTQSVGGHGSALRRDMEITLYWSGPDLPAGGRVPCARLVDVAPTMLDILGIRHTPAIEAMDGLSLLAALRTATGQTTTGQTAAGR